MSIIVISDNNTVVVEHVMDKLGIRHLIDDIFTNIGQVNSDGVLTVKPYHIQEGCTWSFRNLCKARVISEYIRDKDVGLIAYCGDNTNDFCPLVSAMRSGDVAFPRKGYPFDKLLKDKSVPVDIHPWETGNEILNVLQRVLKSR